MSGSVWLPLFGGIPLPSTFFVLVLARFVGAGDKFLLEEFCHLRGRRSCSKACVISNVYVTVGVFLTEIFLQRFFSTFACTGALPVGVPSFSTPIASRRYLSY